MASSPSPSGGIVGTVLNETNARQPEAEARELRDLRRREDRNEREHRRDADDDQQQRLELSRR